MQALLIVNPAAGRGMSCDRARHLQQSLNNADCHTALCFTTEDESAAELVVKNGSQSDMVICCGGDGTLSETVGGILRLKRRPKLAYLPNGTTNDFAKSMGLAHDLNLSAGELLSADSMKLDAGLFNGRPFVYVASFGMFTQCSFDTPRLLKKSLGRLAYKLSSLRELIALKPCHMRVTLDNSVLEEDYLFGCVSNSKSIGGIIRLGDDEVNLSDGKHEVILIRYPKNFRSMREILRALRRHDYTGEHFRIFHTSAVTFESDRPTPWSLDGEQASGNGKINIQTKRAAIDFVLQHAS